MRTIPAMWTPFKCTTQKIKRNIPYALKYYRKEIYLFPNIFFLNRFIYTNEENVIFYKEINCIYFD